MKKKFIGFLSVAAVALGVIMTPATALAYADRDDYYIENLDVDITVNENNVFNIIETITYQFNEPHHGPSRIFTERHTRLRENGDTDRVKAYVSKLNVQSDDAADDIAEQSTYSEGDFSYREIKVGVEDSEYTGEHTYEISYDYNIVSQDPIEDADELYFNIVGTQWDCYIDNVTWTIRMPKDFDATTVGYSVGGFGESGYREEYLTSTVDNNVITGSYLNPLAPYEGINIRATLPEGYFVFTNYKGVAYICYAIIALISVIYIIIKPGKKPVPVVEFYAPDKMTPVEVELTYTGFAPKNVVALIPYLANKGYIDIEQVSKKSYAFTLKKSDLTGLKREEVSLLDGMFPGRVVGTRVTESDLKKSKFYEVTEGIKAFLSNRAMKQFDGTSIARMVVGLIWAFVIFILITALQVTLVQRYAFEAVFFSIAFAVMIPVGMLLVDVINKKIAYLIPILIGGLAVIIQMGVVELDFWSALLSVVLPSAVSLAAFKKKQRKDSNMELYGRVIGFREFIKTAELDKLNMLCEENPNYFYDILSYAYALNLSNVWVKTFEDLQIPISEPVWYTGMTPFNMYAFNRSFDNMMSRAAMAAVPPASSGNSGGGGFSGGGFSGGGSGGGGGGAW